ncbi:hypothetical protein [Ruegeria sp. HKCCSP346]|uniref:hypothetical protein n=1 Tax=Ruegeria sp. HKCCSP346 TaxID=2794830 RepID=UPI001AE4D987|nr:hypothetical protein [Ruegeria sp. HKCCSP346]
MFTRNEIEPDTKPPVSTSPANNYPAVRNKIGQVIQDVVPLTRDAKRKDNESERHCAVYPTRIKAAKLGIGIDEWNSSPHDDRSDQQENMDLPLITYSLKELAAISRFTRPK